MSEKLPPSKTSKRQSSRSKRSKTSPVPKKLKKKSVDSLLYDPESQPGPSRRKFPERKRKVCQPKETVEAAGTSDQVIDAQETTSKETITGQEPMLQCESVLRNLLFQTEHSTVCASVLTEIDMDSDMKLREISKEIPLESLEEKLQRFFKEYASSERLQQSSDDILLKTLITAVRDDHTGAILREILQEILEWKSNQPYPEWLQQALQERPPRPFLDRSQLPSRDNILRTLTTVIRDDHTETILQEILQKVLSSRPDQPYPEWLKQTLQGRLQQSLLKRPQQSSAEFLSRMLATPVNDFMKAGILLAASQWRTNEPFSESSKQSLQESPTQSFKERFNERPQQPFPEKSRPSLQGRPRQGMSRYQLSFRQAI